MTDGDRSTRRSSTLATLLTRGDSNRLAVLLLRACILLLVAVAATITAVLIVNPGSSTPQQSTGWIGLVSVIVPIAGLVVSAASAVFSWRSVRKDPPEVWRIADEIWREEMADRETLPGKRARRLHEIGER